jgi:hypothetical protein
LVCSTYRSRLSRKIVIDDVDRLLEKVIDIEVTSHTPSPTVDPSVHVILIGHSMGGIVAADAILSITADQPIDATDSSSTVLLPNTSTALNTLMFPYIQGVLAFDTPYLGIAPGVVAHGAEEKYNTASSAFAQISGLSGALWGANATVDTSNNKKEKPKEPPKALPAPEMPASPWARWGKVALAAGGAVAVAGAGAAAFVNRDKITEGWGWVGSHLEFVGCLMRGEELKKRVAGMVTLNKEMDVGWANLYTRLGKRAVSKETGSLVGSVVGNQRTFCSLPKSEVKMFWREAINDMASDEPGAHMSKLFPATKRNGHTKSLIAMFFPKDNPGYEDLTKCAQGLIVRWVQGEWYESSVENQTAINVEAEEFDLG